MNHFVRTLGIAAALFITAAEADAAKVDGYSAAFPCQAKTTSQILKAGKMNIPLASRS